MQDLHQEHSGTGDNIGRDKIVKIYLSTIDYQQLEKQLSKLQLQKVKLQANIEKYPNDDDFKIELLEVDWAIGDMESKIDSFKSNVARLYETFTEIEIDTERLRLAKGHFDRGEFREADAILKAEAMIDDVIKAKESQDRGEKMVKRAKQRREQLANEFWIKAQLWQAFYTEPDWFNKTIEFYERALDAARLRKILFSYAYFQSEQNQFKEAENL